jgi:hypothetical protein
MHQPWGFGTGWSDRTFNTDSYSLEEEQFNGLRILGSIQDISQFLAIHLSYQ